MTERKEITKIQELMYELKVSQVMTTNVITVSPQTPMKELREIMRTKRISGAPVMEGEKLVGIISIEDFIKWLSDGGRDCPVSERMTREVQTIYSDEPLVHAVSKLGGKGFGRFPVMDRETNKLVGLVTNGDPIKGLLKKMEVDYRSEEIHRYRASHIFEDIVADKATLYFEYSIAGGDIEHAGECASRLKKSLTRLGVPLPIVRRAAIASYEAEMNTIIFSLGGTMTVRVRPHQLSIAIADKGPGIEDIEKAMQPGFSTAPGWVRELGFGAGMGLDNIKKCADEMNLESTVGEGTHLKAKIYLEEK